MKACTLRLKAAELIEKRGHVKFRREAHPHGNAPMCILGALCLVGMKDAWSGVYRNGVTKALRDMGFKDAIDAARWNNAPARDGSEVIARLREGCQ